MIKLINMTDEDCLFAIKEKEFSDDVLKSSKNVAIIMSQDWCPQWTQMNGYLKDLSLDKKCDIDINVYIVLYNLKSFYVEFMNIKENNWKNNLIPYVRYYVDGKLVNNSNYVWKDKFLDIFNGTK